MIIHMKGKLENVNSSERPAGRSRAPGTPVRRAPGRRAQPCAGYRAVSATGEQWRPGRGRDSPRLRGNAERGRTVRVRQKNWAFLFLWR